MLELFRAFDCATIQHTPLEPRFEAVADTCSSHDHALESRKDLLA